MRRTIARFARRFLPPAGPPSPGDPAEPPIVRTMAGRLCVLSAALLALLWLLRQAVTLPDIADVFRRVVALAFIGSALWLLGRAAARQRRRLLWRVRRKLILSYIFLGFVPVVLIVAFALAGGVVLYTNVAAYLFHDGVGELVDDVGRVADTAAAEIDRTPGAARAVLDAQHARATARFPDLSLAIVPSPGANGAGDPPPVTVRAGPWRHAPVPGALPVWVSAARGFSGVLALVEPAADAEDRLLVRAAAPLAGGGAVVVDLPVDTDVAARLHDETSLRIVGVTVVDEASDARPLAGSPSAVPPRQPVPVRSRSAWSLFRQTVAFLDFTDWSTGRTGRVSVSLDAPVGRLYERMAAVQSARLASTFGSGWDGLLALLVVLGVLFAIVQGSALVMGAVLARSITSAVHELFIGTERVRSGDFGYRIRIDSRDQLGDLAESFNRMSAGMAHLLHVQREKQRLDEELRIAREIQRSLLPVEAPRLEGLSVADLCEPAREVGGDYYDFFRIGPRQLGVLVADVSGKGTSAALYMAVLKGLVQALSHAERSPRRLLIDLNRRLADQLDNRSFVTMLYAVIDLDAGTLTCARAGHTPLVVVSDGRSEVVMPDGMVLGLRLPDAGRRFEDLLVEHTRPIGAGDLVVLYTDGLTEAMNPQGDLFGDEALAALLTAHRGLDVAAIRERILREVRAFVGDAEPHDDMTMVVLKVTDAAA